MVKCLGCVLKLSRQMRKHMRNSLEKIHMSNRRRGSSWYRLPEIPTSLFTTNVHADDTCRRVNSKIVSSLSVV